jgi:hypothetical protein
MTPQTKRVLTGILAVLFSGVAVTYPQYLGVVLAASNIASLLFGITIPSPGQAVVKTGFTVPPPNDPQQPQ